MDANSAHDIEGRRFSALDIAENQRADRARMDAILQRLGSVESSLAILRQTHDTVQGHAVEIQQRQTEIIEKLADFAVRFSIHVETESHERAIFTTIAEKVVVHSERITALERLLWWTIGAGGMASMAAIGWVVNYLQAMHR